MAIPLEKVKCPDCDRVGTVKTAMGGTHICMYCKTFFSRETIEKLMAVDPNQTKEIVPDDVADSKGGEGRAGTVFASHNNGSRSW